MWKEICSGNLYHLQNEKYFRRWNFRKQLLGLIIAWTARLDFCIPCFFCRNLFISKVQRSRQTEHVYPSPFSYKARWNLLRKFKKIQFPSNKKRLGLILKPLVFNISYLFLSELFYQHSFCRHFISSSIY